MKILYVDLKYDYGIKSRGLSPIGQKGFSDVFKNLGHEVICFCFDDYFKRLPQLQEDLLKFADEQRPDLIYFMLYTDQFFPETLLQLKKKYKTISWFGDDQFRFENFTYKYAPLFTYCVTTDLFAVSKYKRIGVKNVILSQWAALNIEIPNGENISYKYDISFVGGAGTARKWYIDKFAKAGLKVAAFGYHWPNGAVSLETMVDIFRTSRINLNLSNSVNLDLRYLLNGPTNILRALKPGAKNTSQMKARSFEIPYYGGFQLTGYLPGLEDYFEIGKEIACYTDIDEAIKLARYYLENEELRENIKRKGIDRARRMHTYLHRHQEIFAKLKDLEL